MNENVVEEVVEEVTNEATDETMEFEPEATENGIESGDLAKAAGVVGIAGVMGGAMYAKGKADGIKETIAKLESVLAEYGIKDDQALLIVTKVKDAKKSKKQKKEKKTKEHKPIKVFGHEIDISIKKSEKKSEVKEGEDKSNNS